MKKHILIVCTSLVFFILGCKNSFVKEEKFDFPVLKEKELSILEPRNSNAPPSADYQVIYIGKKTDTILISGYKQLSDNSNKSKSKYSRIPAKGELSLFIDTLSTVSNITIDKKRYKAYPVYIVNNTEDTLYIGVGEWLNIVSEAKNNEGKWQLIEERFMYFDDFGSLMPEINIPPHNMVVTSAPINEGSFKTKLRLNFMGLLSEEFSGSINLGQLTTDSHPENNKMLKI